MELIVLGSCGTYPSFQRACSSYLIKNDKQSILIDIGSGAFSNLQKWEDPFNLKALILTHSHPDHLSDFFALRYFLELAPGVQTGPLKVYLTPQTEKNIFCFIGDDSEEKVRNLFDFTPIKMENVKIGDYFVEFCPVTHVDLTYGVKVGLGDKKIVYSSDTSYDSKLERLAKNADLFICDATFQGEKGKEYFHMTSSEAGIMAEKAKVNKLVLTHLWPHMDEEKSLQEAAVNYRGEIIIAKEHQRIGV